MEKKHRQKDSELPERQERSPVVSDTPVMDWLRPRVTVILVVQIQACSVK